MTYAVTVSPSNFATNKILVIPGEYAGDFLLRYKSYPLLEESFRSTKAALDQNIAYSQTLENGLQALSNSLNGQNAIWAGKVALAVSGERRAAIVWGVSGVFVGAGLAMAIYGALKSDIPVTVIGGVLAVGCGMIGIVIYFKK